MILISVMSKLIMKRICKFDLHLIFYILLFFLPFDFFSVTRFLVTSLLVTSLLCLVTPPKGYLEQEMKRLMNVPVEVLYSLRKHFIPLSVNSGFRFSVNN